MNSAATKKLPKAYSYLRFSTPEQQRGDSFRRQSHLAKEYAKENGLDLDEKLSFQDLGVSAYRGANVDTGQLGTFLDAAREGVVERGSYLLVESLDRISRNKPRVALRVLEDIVDAGITLVTLGDRKVYTAESLDNNPTDLLFSIIILMRAHDESETKARRLKAAWEGKRARVKDRPLTAICPAWLKLNRGAGKFEVIEDRAAVVRRIYEMARSGIGQNLIAKTLNREGVPPFRAGTMWHRSYVIKLLENPAVTGTMTPHRIEYEGGKRRRKPLEPVEGYYPAIISPDLFQEVQALRESRTPARGRHAEGALNNVFGGLARCPLCGAAMNLVNKGKGWRYLVCSRGRTGAGCSYHSVPYDAAESAFLRNWRSLVAACPADDAEALAIQMDIENAEQALGANLDAREALIEALAKVTIQPQSVMERIADLDGLIRETQEELGRQKGRLASFSRTILDHKLSTLAAAAGADPIDRRVVNAALRQLLKAVVIDFRNGTLVFQWRHGHETELVFAWPEAPAAMEG